MVKAAVKDAVAPMMEFFLKQSRKRHISDSDDDSDQEVNALEECPFDIEEFQVNETFALSALRHPPRKRLKTGHLSPMTTAKVACQRLARNK